MEPIRVDDSASRLEFLDGTLDELVLLKLLFNIHEDELYEKPISADEQKIIVSAERRSSDYTLEDPQYELYEKIMSVAELKSEYKSLHGRVYVQPAFDMFIEMISRMERR